MVKLCFSQSKTFDLRCKSAELVRPVLVLETTESLRGRGELTSPEETDVTERLFSLI